MEQFTEEQMRAVRRAVSRAAQLVAEGTPPAEAVELGVQEVEGEPADAVEAFLRARRRQDARVTDPLQAGSSGRGG